MILRQFFLLTKTEYAHTHAFYIFAKNKKIQIICKKT